MVSGYAWFLDIQGFWIFMDTGFSGFLDIQGSLISRIYRKTEFLDIHGFWIFIVSGYSVLITNILFYLNFEFE